MTDFVLILVTGLGLGALYFLARGLSIIYGLMGVLNFAHGAFMMAGPTPGSSRWEPCRAPFPLRRASPLPSSSPSSLVPSSGSSSKWSSSGRSTGTIQQVLVTVGLSLASVAAAQGIWGADPRTVEKPEWMASTTMPSEPAAQRPVPVHRGARSLPRPAGAAALHPPRPDHPRWCREPHHGRGARHQRAPDVHDRLCPRRPGCRAGRTVVPRSTPGRCRPRRAARC